MTIREEHLPEADCWVVEEEERVVGFVALLGNEVGAIFVDPDLHGHGFGRALMDKARSFHDTLELEVFEANAIGRAFYDRYGFVRVGRHTHRETGHTCLRLRLKSGGWEPEEGA